MPKQSPSVKPTASRSAKAANAVRRAIKKINPVKEPPMVGKPVIIDPTEASPAPDEQKRRTRGRRAKKDSP